MKFVWYNTRFFQYYWEIKRRDPNSIFELSIDNKRWQNLFRINQLFSENPSGLIQDRTQHISHPFQIETVRPYKWQPVNHTFADACLATAKAIADSTSKQIAVKWSGGIDSTVVLVALLQTVSWDRITVICNNSSKQEYPGFWRDVIEPNLHYVDPGAWMDDPWDFFTVSGDGGDTTWAVIDESFYKKHQTFNQPWRDWIDKKIMPDVDFVEEFVSWSGRDIDTVLELRAWFYLCCKWQDKIMQLWHTRPGLPCDQAWPFYDFTDHLELWTINNLDRIIGDSWTSYKMPAKEFISELHYDSHYLHNKSKVNSVSLVPQSWIWTIENGPSKLAIDKDFNPHGLPGLPFVCMHQFEDWNDQFGLVPMHYLQS